jgi:hypothetical protein
MVLKGGNLLGRFLAKTEPKRLVIKYNAAGQGRISPFGDQPPDLIRLKRPAQFLNQNLSRGFVFLPALIPLDSAHGGVQSLEKKRFPAAVRTKHQIDTPEC